MYLLSNYNHKRKAYDKAEALCRETLEFYRQLAVSGPGRYQPLVAWMYDKLGSQYSYVEEYKKAVTAYLKAREIHRAEVASSSRCHSHNLNRNWNFLRAACKKIKAYDKLEAACLQDLAFLQPLAAIRPEEFDPMVAKARRRLGWTLRQQKAYDKSEKAYQEALTIYRQLAGKQPERYREPLANTRYKLGAAKKWALSMNCQLEGARWVRMPTTNPEQYIFRGVIDARIQARWE